MQREFGPIYLEQVGLAVVTATDGGSRAIGVLIDGKVSLFGLSAAVDDLSLTYTVDGGGSPFDPSRWRVDVAGFAVAADISGVTLAGGLRKFTPAGGGVEYLGMLLARVGGLRHLACTAGTAWSGRATTSTLACSSSAP